MINQFHTPDKYFKMYSLRNISNYVATNKIQIILKNIPTLDQSMKCLFRRNNRPFHFIRCYANSTALKQGEKYSIKREGLNFFFLLNYNFIKL